MKNRFTYWPGDFSPPALSGRQSPMATKSAWSTWIGPCRQFSLVVSRLVAPWYCWKLSQAARSVNQSSRLPMARPPMIARKCERLCGLSPSRGRTYECSPTVGK